MAERSTPESFMPASIRLGRIGGIPIGLHYSWFFIAALITFSLAAHFRGVYPGWSPGVIWSVSVLTAGLFFATLLAHELSHSLVARTCGLRVRSITLFALGGVANIEGEDASTAKTEFLVAIAGPLVSFAIGALCIGVAVSLGWWIEDGATGVAGAVLGWLGSINILLGAFNLIPGYPLDGGRILRAILWGVYRDMVRATRNAARVGQVVATLLVGWGLVQFFAGAGFGGLWLAFIGWFLLVAAQASYTEVSLAEALRDVHVGDVMGNDCVTVDPAMTVQQLVDDVLLRRGRRCVVVERDGRLVGLVTPHEVRAVDRSRWMTMPVGQVMRPIETLRTVTPDASVADALHAMASNDINQLPVVSDGRLEGVITRGHILQLLQARAELKGLNKAA